MKKLDLGGNSKICDDAGDTERPERDRRTAPTATIGADTGRSGRGVVGHAV